MLVFALLLIAGTVVLQTSSSCNFGETKSRYGRLQICENGDTYSDVCFSGWSLNESSVFCLSGDRPGAEESWEEGGRTSGVKVDCIGTELHLSECRYSVVDECFELLRVTCQMCDDENPCPATGVCVDDTTCECINNCENGGSCHAGMCYCPSGYSGDTCEDILCPLGCQNGGNCLSNGTCECPGLYYGDSCQNLSCQPDCQNDGNCTSNGTCECTGLYYGDSCQNLSCQPDCQNDGNCLSNGTCECPGLYYGDSCERILCLKECQNNGSCLTNCTCVCFDHSSDDSFGNNLFNSDCLIPNSITSIPDNWLILCVIISTTFMVGCGCGVLCVCLCTLFCIAIKKVKCNQSHRVQRIYSNSNFPNKESSDVETKTPKRTRSIVYSYAIPWDFMRSRFHHDTKDHNTQPTSITPYAVRYFDNIKIEELT
ncbi:Von Willebrand factor D and EGF domain-containing protein-like [Oopsacas minuta]|uniref:von Willebrand factor D and EGF domain-containing protein-like n=1 Tax=Oopsacas minuta TaxID=111878 RepID=A0AAV7KAF9_9METZ|nr:Von Willebrand factor D and EGF domain-containing protein-like [Oopsacas minuta]